MKKWLSYIITTILGIIFGVGWTLRKCKDELIDKEERANRNGKNMKVACKWLRVAQNGKNITYYFNHYGINSVAIYGMGELGICLLKELEKTSIDIKYIIDRNANKQVGEYPIFLPEDDLPDVQVLVVTPVYDYTIISEKLKKKISGSIVSLEKVLDDL